MRVHQTLHACTISERKILDFHTEDHFSGPARNGWSQVVRPYDRKHVLDFAVIVRNFPSSNHRTTSSNCKIRWRPSKEALRSERNKSPLSFTIPCARLAANHQKFNAENLTVVPSFRGSEAKNFPVPRILLSLGTGASVVVAHWEYKLFSRQTEHSFSGLLVSENSNLIICFVWSTIFFRVNLDCDSKSPTPDAVKAETSQAQARARAFKASLFSCFDAVHYSIYSKNIFLL